MSKTTQRDDLATDYATLAREYAAVLEEKELAEREAEWLRAEVTAVRRDSAAAIDDTLVLLQQSPSYQLAAERDAARAEAERLKSGAKRMSVLVEAVGVLFDMFIRNEYTPSTVAERAILDAYAAELALARAALTARAGGGGMMDAGRELDALVAEKVFKHEIVMRRCYYYQDGGHWGEVESYRDADDLSTPNHFTQLPCYQESDFWEVVPEYSIDIAAAWQVVEKLAPAYVVRVQMFFKKWQCALEIRDGGMRFPIDSPRKGDAHGDADTAAHAICLAALKAVGAL